MGDLRESVRALLAFAPAPQMDQGGYAMAFTLTRAALLASDEDAKGLSASPPGWPSVEALAEAIKSAIYGPGPVSDWNARALAAARIALAGPSPVGGGEGLEGCGASR